MLRYTRAILFVGGPLIDDDARFYAVSQGIGVVELSGSRYQVVQDPFLQKEFSYGLDAAAGE